MVCIALIVCTVKEYQKRYMGTKCGCGYDRIVRVAMIERINLFNVTWQAVDDRPFCTRRCAIIYEHIVVAVF